ncbi:MAG: class I SAM-dependent rRNA methyltransferase [Sphingobacteriales bacterium]|nr:class I SAM-dependent rRNA methyltransferase [Sphingobacteriales bacterium]
MADFMIGYRPHSPVIVLSYLCTLMQKVFLKRKIAPRIANGHPWIFANEVEKIEGDIQGGETVEVFTHDKKFVGKGYINPKSQILVRLLTRQKVDEINEAFFLRRIASCWDYRQKIGYTENCRLVFGEADSLPQLIIDKFNDYFVIQTLALGIDKWKPAIVDALNKIFAPKGIYERNDVPVRELEGLPQQKGFLSAPFDTKIIIEENGLKFHVDLENGQKTGYFLDQQDNRRAIRHIVKDAEVLGAFTYTGTFEIHAAYYGAKSVLGLDISENAVTQANRNAALNGLQDICRFETANAFDVLKQWGKDGRQYDVVMLDPPAFTKSRETIQKAITGYKEINLRGMKLVKPGGFLVTSSCTNLVNPELFLQIIDMAAKDARRKIRQVTFQAQASDHPIIWGMDNTQYLKFLIVQVE